MLLSYIELVELAERGVITDVQPGAINAASIDVHLGKHFKYESRSRIGACPIIDLSEREPLPLNDVVCEDGEFITILPGQFILAHTTEMFNLPNDISAQFLLKSSVARNGLEHAAATWCDAGWNGSVLTLELRNVTQYHRLRLKPGMAVGQMKFYRHTAVPDEQSYAARGRYNGNVSVEGILP